MATPIDRETLETVFGPDELLTLPEPESAGIRHEPSARFLRSVGIPSRPNPWFDLVDGSQGDLKKLRDCYDDMADRWTNLSDNAGSWLLLGMIPYDDIALDGATGILHCLPDEASEAYVLNKDLPSFAHFLYLLEEERPNYDFESDQENLDPEGAARRIEDRMRAIDPESLSVEHSRWHDILEYVAEPEAR